MFYKYVNLCHSIMSKYNSLKRKAWTQIVHTCKWMYSVPHHMLTFGKEMMIGGKETKMESADGLLPANGDGS